VSTWGGLTHAAYGAIGQTVGVATRYAGSMFGKLDSDSQDQARRLLVQMVRPGVDGRDVRRSATLSDLAEDSLPVLGRLIDARLVVASRGPDGQATMDLAHGGLVRHWVQLKTWVDADREFCTWLDRLRAALRQWQGQLKSGGSAEDLLLRGAALEEARGWAAARGGDMSAAMREYVASSESAQARQRADEESRRQQEAVRSREFAAAEVASAKNLAVERRRVMQGWVAAAILAVWSLAVTGALVAHWVSGK
jgi:hypothetical protein